MTLNLIGVARAKGNFQPLDSTLTTLSSKAFSGSGNIVLATSPTIVTPTIASFANAAHNHQDAAGGAQLDHGLALTGLADDDHTQYAIKTPGSSTRNAIKASGAFIALALQAAPSGTPNTLEIQSADGTLALARFTSLGQLILRAGADAAIPGGTSGVGCDGSNNLELRAGASIELRPVAGQGMRLYDTTITFTSQSSANLNLNNAVVAPFTITNLSAGGAIRLIIKAGGAQSTNTLQEWQNNSNVLLASISSAGIGRFAGLRLDVTPTAETITPTHTITISVNGTNYKIPLVAA